MCDCWWIDTKLEKHPIFCLNTSSSWWYGIIGSIYLLNTSSIAVFTWKIRNERVCSWEKEKHYRNQLLSHKTASNVVTSLMTDFLTGGRGGIGCHMLKIARENLVCKWQEPFIEPNIEFIEQLLKRCKTFPNLCCHGLYHWVPGLFICSISPQELCYLSPPAPGILSRFFLDLQELNLHSKI